MNVARSSRARLRRTLGASAIAAVLAAPLALSPPASAYTDSYICPATGTTITLASGVGCTNTTYSWLLSVTYSNANLPWHCAVAKAGPEQDGSSANVIPGVCGYGAAGRGDVTTSASSPRDGFARGKNDSIGTWGGFWGVARRSP